MDALLAAQEALTRNPPPHRGLALYLRSRSCIRYESQGRRPVKKLAQSEASECEAVGLGMRGDTRSPGGAAQRFYSSKVVSPIWACYGAEKMLNLMQNLFLH